MSSALKEMDRAELVNLERLAHLLKGLNPAEAELKEGKTLSKAELFVD